VDGDSAAAEVTAFEEGTREASERVGQIEAERRRSKEEMPSVWGHYCTFQRGREWRVETRRVYCGVECSGAPEEFLQVFLRELRDREDPGGQYVIFPRFAEAYAIAMEAAWVVLRVDGEWTSAAPRVAAEGRTTSPAGSEERYTDANCAPAGSDETVQGDGALGQERVPPDRDDSDGGGSTGSGDGEGCSC
jgi:hypothetical protein